VSAATHRILAVNDAAIEAYGYTRDEFVGMRMDGLVPASRRRDRHPFGQGQRARSIWQGQHVTKSRCLLDVQLIVTPTGRNRDRRDRSGDVLTCVAWPVAAVQPATTRRSLAFERAPVGLLAVDERGAVLEANQAAARLLHRPLSGLRRAQLTDLAAPAGRASARQVLDALASGTRWSGTLVLDGAGRPMVDAEVSVWPSKAGGPHVVALHERSELDAALRRSDERYRRLSDHDRAVREEERARIARELHDQLGQSLSAFKMDLAWLSAFADRDEPATVRAAIAGMMSRVDTAISIVRRIAGDLRPGVLDRLGLLAAIEWQAAEFERRTGVRCQMACQGECPPFDRRQSTEIFRIVQETLANVSRHAEASSVKLEMTCWPDRVALRISDNGRGIPQAAIESEQSLGLIGMRERATILGGTLTLARGRRRGTDAVLIVPSAPSLVGPPSPGRSQGGGEGRARRPAARARTARREASSGEGRIGE